MKRKVRKILFGILIFIILLIIILFLLWCNGVIIINDPLKKEYEVIGVDVSSYQGVIDWDILSKQNIKFAFIKATEGSSFVDEYFATNYENANKTNLKIGAYHFFSYDSNGNTQADNFIKNVERTENMLPPVIDIEFYGDKYKNIPETKETKEQLNILINKLEEHYEMNPIIYATYKSYNLYIINDFKENTIWIRDVFKEPKLKDNREWTFWQYTDKKRLDGYIGKEKAIDMNVFNGTYEEFENMFYNK